MYKLAKNPSSSEDYISTPDEKLLNEESCSKASFDVEDGSQPSRKRYWLNLSRTAFLAHIALTALYTVLFIFFVHRYPNQGNQRPNLIYSPGDDAIEMERKMVHATFEDKNPFKGLPSDELDHAWHTLFVNSNIRVSAEDLIKINRTSVPVTDAKGGYYATPDVYHQLHGLVIYSDYYHVLENPITPMHVDHCIDNLRQNIMCKGDVSLLTYKWVPDDKAPKPNFDIEHECVNWDKLDSWAKTQSFDIFDEKTLVHPELGASFPAKEFKNAGKVPGHPEYHLKPAR